MIEEWEEIKVPTTEEEEEELKLYLQEQHPKDIAEYIAELDDREMQAALIKVLEPEDAATVLFEMDDQELLTDVLLELPRALASAIVNEIPNDEAADMLEDMDESDRSRILSLFEEEDADDIADLLTYDSDTAGGLMTTEFVVVPVFVKAEKAIEIIRLYAPDAETIYYVYVIDGLNHLVGILSLRELIIAGPETLIGDIMIQNVTSCNVRDDQEEVADLMTKYDLLALPVVDDEDHILGIITVDDIVDVIQDEASEDIYRMAGTTEAELDEDASVVTAFLSRLPWLLITICGGFCSGAVLDHFEMTLSQVAALIIFIPMMTGIAGNVGTQSCTVTVRGIAMGNITTKVAVTTILREALLGFALGTTIGSIVCLVSSFWQHSFALGLTVGLTILLNNFMAALLGTVVPLALERFHIDPAVASSAFITTTSDIVGLLNYSVIAIVIFGL
ncbi:MAG: magnesium transporter [Peptococcaceae bacterium]|nr:magnesium transporter [Peptococcaceae bacterium]